jgi:hypothetical protein
MGDIGEVVGILRVVEVDGNCHKIITRDGVTVYIECFHPASPKHKKRKILFGILRYSENLYVVRELEDQQICHGKIEAQL